MAPTESEIIERLQRIDTPTISNVVGTYPRSDNCMKLYDAWYGKWYTDTTIKCVYPEMGPRVGYVATAVFSERTDKYTGMGRWVLPEHLERTRKPVVLIADQQFDQVLRGRVGLFGEIMTTQYKALGVVGVVTNGPMRDIDAIKPLGVQYYCTGVTPGHGDFIVRDVDIPVEVGGMSVMPSDMVHMDMHGVVKFPSHRMGEVLERAERLLAAEAETMRIFKEPGFSLKKWRDNVEGSKTY